MRSNIKSWLCIPRELTIRMPCKVNFLYCISNYAWHANYIYCTCHAKQHKKLTVSTRTKHTHGMWSELIIYKYQSCHMNISFINFYSPCVQISSWRTPTLLHRHNFDGCWQPLSLWGKACALLRLIVDGTLRWFLFAIVYNSLAMLYHSYIKHAISFLNYSSHCVQITSWRSPKYCIFITSTDATVTQSPHPWVATTVAVMKRPSLAPLKRWWYPSPISVHD